MNTKIIFDEATDGDVYALIELAPELQGVVEALLEHVNDGYGEPLCSAQHFERDLLVDAALSSDCDACRLARGVALLNDKQWDGSTIGQRPLPEWEPQPMEGADTIVEEKQKRGDGR